MPERHHKFIGGTLPWATGPSRTNARSQSVRDQYMSQLPRITEEWEAEAACLGRPTAWWYADWVNRDVEPMPKGMRHAIAKCFTCPVRTECLALALMRREQWGIWGGSFPEDRRKKSLSDIGEVAALARNRAEEHHLVEREESA